MRPWWDFIGALDDLLGGYNPTEYERLQDELLALQRKKEMKDMRAQIAALKEELGEADG